MRNWTRAASILGASAVLVGAPAAVAFADCSPHGNGVNSGSAYFSVGPSGSSQSSTWNLGNRTVYVGTITSSGMSTSRCHDMMFDWATDSGHYDARQVRNCDPGSQASSQSSGSWPANEPSGWAGRDVNGLQKGAGCVYNQSSESFVECVQFPDRLPQCVFGNGPGASPYPSNENDSRPIAEKKNFTRYISRSENGTLTYNSGGNIASSTS